MPRPANTAAYKKFHTSLVRYLYEHCIIEETPHSRLYFQSAWAWWLMFDLQEAPISCYGWRMANPDGVLRYIKADYLVNPKYKPPHDDWKTQSIVAMINAGVLLSNCRSGSSRRYKESRFIERYWSKIELFTPTIDKNAVGPRQSNDYLSRRLENHERILKKICGLIGLDEFSDR